MMDFKDYYQTLGVSKRATADELKKAYRRLARKFHPDVNPGDREAERRFKEISEAYEVVGTPETRRKYDELGANWKAYEQASAAGAPFGGGRPFGAGGGRVRTVSEDELRDLFGEHSFSDFFETFFGGAARGSAGSRAPFSRRGRDREHPLPLTLEQAYAGLTQRLTIQGDGGARTVDVRIPPGVDDGARVRVAGHGEPGAGGAAAGDLFLRIALRPHAVYRRTGRDLSMDVTVPLTTAVLGGEIVVPTVGGADVRLRVPPTTQPGQTFRVKGHGMPTAGSGNRGDLYATVRVTLPRRLSPEARRHFEALAAIEAAEAGHSAA